MKNLNLIYAGIGEAGIWHLTKSITGRGLDRKVAAKIRNGLWAHAYRPDADAWGNYCLRAPGRLRPRGGR